ncbi:IclR family transcriptional regulator domain-containing protein [Microvirga brassicacearum]|uniref:IclR family transcriptional regulator n=1 Tax=Microvirga brassicacearum TaxID=2580413 RepID=A0A5N3P817_9HYPH|nr:IclR family transcriptional regulator C-terminal domain-containing protein [Microvirga brassicacearum]KAB0265872.1 IclR family transcriptional regulator [Microvirga brassicacearum]
MEERTAKSPEGESREFVASLEKGLAVIEAFGPDQPRLTLTDVAKRTGITRAAARRYLHTLAKLNYADFDGRYFSLRPRILRLGYAYLSSSSLPERLQPALEKISSLTGESSSAAMLDGDDIVYVARSATQRIMSVSLGVGTRLPAYCTSLGRAILAHQPPAEIDAYLRRVRLEPRTPKTITRKPEFLAALDEVKRKGCAVIDEELELGLRSIAIPLVQPNGSVRIALNVSTQAARVAAKDMESRFLPALRDGAEGLRHIL